jgi:hypothetical protein
VSRPALRFEDHVLNGLVIGNLSVSATEAYVLSGCANQTLVPLRNLTRGLDLPFAFRHQIESRAQLVRRISLRFKSQNGLITLNLELVRTIARGSCWKSL